MDDLLIAQYIMKNGYKEKTIYHDSSFIFMTTNEKAHLYQHLIKNKNSILTVTSSGDQIFNTVLESPKAITAYDISKFPKYLVELKRAGILSLSKEEFIDFFFINDIHKDEYYDDLYFRVRVFLKKDYQNFWDGLFNLYDWPYITRSLLFSQQTISLQTILENNNYLNSFDKIKTKLSDININYVTGNISDIASSNEVLYDFINLSSIIYYMSNYRELLQKLPLTSDGVALTYLYNVSKEFVDGYPECEFIKFKNCNEGVMMYQKR